MSPLQEQRADQSPLLRVACLADHSASLRTRHARRRQAGPRGCARGGDRAVSPVPASGASCSPLEALEACRKSIPLSGSLPPQPLAASGFRNPQPGDPGSQRPELQSLGSHREGRLGRGLRVARQDAGDTIRPPPHPGPLEAHVHRPLICVCPGQLPVLAAS